jgi:divalent metal cation (Fe/Co/Zn/Cd) transporter
MDTARAALIRRALRLEYVTIGWNALEGGAAIAAGIVARSVSLAAFGLDSCVEVFASAVAAWQLREGVEDDREGAALRLIGVAYLVVGIYVGAQAILRLVHGGSARVSIPGMVLTAAALVIMSLLGVSKRRIGVSLQNETLTAEATFSLVDAGLAGSVLVGLVLNASVGWGVADPLVALGLALFSLREGLVGLGLL